MNVPFSDMATLRWICDRYHIDNVRFVCSGIVRATQHLRIGEQEICTDEVLIEEAAYESLDDMEAEINNLSIKMGQFSPFVTTSTYPPKYCYRDHRRAVAWFVTSVPVLSLSTVLHELEIWFPSRYNRHVLELINDVGRTCLLAVRKAWRRRDTPAKAVQRMLQTIRSAVPHYVSVQERLQFAALLVNALMGKHAAGVFHNNITAYTVFLSDALTPRFLNNYSGIDAPGLRFSVPDIILQRNRDSSFGEQSEDTFALALLVYQILTGQSAPGRTFTLDGTVEYDVPRVLQTRFAPPFEIFSEVLALAGLTWYLVARFIDKLGSTCDYNRFVHQRLLCRCSGSPIRSFPLIGPVLNVWFPTRTARVLISILDFEENRKVFGSGARLSRHKEFARNATLAYLRAALPCTVLNRSSLLARAVQDIIDHAIGRPMQAFDGELVSRSARRISIMTTLSRRVTPVLFLVVVLLATSNHQFRPIPAGLETPLPVAAGQGDKFSDSDRKFSPAGETAADAITPVASAKKRPVAQRQRVHRTATTAPPRSATLGLFDKNGRVFAVRAENAGYDLNELVMPVNKSSGISIGTKAGNYAKVFVMKAVNGDYGAVIAARRCTTTKKGRIQGKFYEALGYSGLGEEITVTEGDLISFNAFILYRIRRQSTSE